MHSSNAHKRSICYILPEFNENTDSHFSYIYDFVELLSRSADIFLLVEKGHDPRGSFRAVRHVYRLHLKIFPLRILEEFFWLCVVRARGCRRFYVHYSYAGALLSSLITRVFGGVTFYWNCGMPWLYGKQWPLRAVLRAVPYLVTGTATMRELYAKEYGLPLSQIRIMPNWVRTTAPPFPNSHSSVREKLGLPKDRPIVLFVHRLSPRKGADRVIDLARKTLRGNALFVLVGNGPLAGAIHDRILAEGLSDKIIMVGSVSQKEVAAYFQASDVFIMPSREEGFPHVLLEAMSAGIPFVATAVGGVRDIIPASLQKYCVKDGDLDGFVSRLDELLEDSALRSEIGRIGKEHVKKFDIHSIVSQFLVLFET